MATGRSHLRFLLASTIILVAVSAAFAPAAHATPATDTGSVYWVGPYLIAGGLVNAAEPSIAYTPDGTAHALWQSNGSIYYASRKPGQAWSAARRIVSGTSPSLVLDTAGQLHAVFSNEFENNSEIYHIRLANGKWTLPVPVSRTTGASVQPVVVADKSKGLHAAWMDYTPGFWTIYMASWTGGFWSSYPVDNASGKDPSLAVMIDGTVVLAWQDLYRTVADLTGSYDIFTSERMPHTSGNWSFPVDVSIRSDLQPVPSIGVSILAGADNRVHMTWLEGDQEIEYGLGRGLYWPQPMVIARAAGLARGPQIAAGPGQELTIAWDEGEAVWVTRAAPGATQWPASTRLAAPEGDQKEVVLGTMPNGEVALSWVQTDPMGISAVYQAYREARQTNDWPHHIWLPITPH